MPSPDQQIADLLKRVKALETKTDPASVTAAQLRQDTAMGRGAYAGYGIAQNDNYMAEKNVDSTHGINVRYVVADNVQRLLQARISIFLLPYETYNNFAVGGGTGAGTSHSHSHTHGSHSHSHTHGGHVHTVTTVVAAGGVAISQNGSAWNVPSGPQPTLPVDTTTPSADATATTPGADATTEASHTHPISSSSNLGVVTGATATAVTLSIDGDDYTATLGGPFNANMIGLNITSVITTASKTYLSKGAGHTILLTPSGLGRIEAILRLTYFADGSVAA